MGNQFQAVSGGFMCGEIVMSARIACKCGSEAYAEASSVPQAESHFRKLGWKRVVHLKGSHTPAQWQCKGCVPKFTHPTLHITEMTGT